jgi:hypothetical protein
MSLHARREKRGYLRYRVDQNNAPAGFCEARASGYNRDRPEEPIAAHDGRTKYDWLWYSKTRPENVCSFKQ